MAGNRFTKGLGIFAKLVSPGGLDIGGGSGFYKNAGAPTNGGAGTLFNVAGKGSILIDTTNGTMYQNTNTKASPTWTKIMPTGALGLIPLPLSQARILAANDYQNLAATAGVLASNSAPSLARVNGATDIGPRVSWAATVVAEIQWDTVVPNDLDETVAAVFTGIFSMAGATDTPVVTVKAMVGIAGADLGGATTAVAGTTPTSKTRNLTLPAAPQGSKLAVALVPAAHGTDALRLDGAYITYTRK